MTWEDLKRKLTSRKFWVAVTSFATLLLTSLGMDEQGAAQIAAIIMAGAVVMAYIIGEGMVDAENVTTPAVQPDKTEE